MHQREPIGELIGAEDTPPELARRLRLISAARDFSIETLGLPDNGSYRSYADLDRDFVAWNVFAAPEFSLQPKRWCFPVAGCVAYRGYFSRDAAAAKAARLEAGGYDVAVAGVPAYSTLGRFDDPVLNTMLGRGDVDVVAMLFHELAHQELYVKGDTGFNESFATLVEQVGVERWLTARGETDRLEDYERRRRLQRQLMAIVAAARTELEALYRMRLAPEAMRRRKARCLAQLGADLRAAGGWTAHEAPGWLQDGLNNARLASLQLYEGQVPELRELLSQCGGDLRCFYARARERAGN
jgi:predicted aminopeptidase